MQLPEKNGGRTSRPNFAISVKDLLEAGPSRKGTSKKANRKISTSSESDEDDKALEEHTDPNDTDDEDKTVSANISFEELMPVPRVLRSSENSNRRKQHSQIFTETPNKEELERKENEKQRKEKVNKAKTIKRNLDEDSKEDKNKNSKKKGKKYRKSLQSLASCAKNLVKTTSGG